MAIRIPWTKHEVALLIDACIRFENTICTRTEIIKELSKKLRELALKNDIQIDDIYRNENGISIQFQLMMGLLHNEVSGLRNSSKLFTEMKNMYYNDKTQYDKILKEAQTMLESNKKNQDIFVEWLSAQVSPAQLSELYMVYEKIDKFCLQRGILKKALIETTDIKMVNKVLKTVEQNKVFRFTHKREINKIVSAVRYYYKYLKSQESIENDDLGVHQHGTPSLIEKTEIITDVANENEHRNSQTENTSLIANSQEKNDLTRTMQDEILLKKYPIAYKKILDSLRHSLEVVGEKGVTANAIYENIKHIARIDSIEEILDKASWAKKNGSRYIFSEEIIDKNEIIEENNDYISEEASSEQSRNQKVDFYNISNLAFTKPSSLSYFGETVVDLRSWTDLYVRFVRFLYEDYPENLPVGQLFHGANRIDFGNYDLSQKMIAPKQFADNLYVETNLSANNIVGKIKALLELCLVDYENVVISYEFKETSTEKTPSDYEAAKLVLEADEFESDDDLQEAYFRYKKAAELGNKDGMYNLGLYYLNGIYVEQDDKMALLWLERAAEKGHSDAANDIGVYYHNSKNLRGKHFKAIKWYKRGAELGNKYSQCNLGWHYEYGMGCEVDLSLAKKYYELSAEQGFEDAIKYLKRLNSKLNSSEASDTLSEFSKWLEETLKMSPSTIRGYVSSVKVISEKAVEWNLIPHSFYKMDNADEVKTYVEVLFKDEIFKKFNEEQHNRFTASLNRYLEFRTGNASSYSRRGVRSNKENDFYEWLLNEKKLAPSTCRTHMSGISEVSKFVNSNNLLDISIFDADEETIRVLFSNLLENNEFIKLNETIYNRGRTAIYKYLEFLGLDVPENSTTFRDYSEKEETFFEWLVSEKKLAVSTCRSHKIGINDVNKYVVENGLLSTSIFDADDDTVNSLFMKLLCNNDFLSFNETIYNRGRTAIYKYMEFLGLTVPEASTTLRDYSEKENTFFEWLVNEKKLAVSTCRSHKIGINDVNKYVVENGLLDTSIFDADNDTVNTLFVKLLTDSDFLKFNEGIYNRGRTSMYKYMEFLGLEIPEVSVYFKSYSDKEEDFYKWLLNEKKLSPSTSRHHKAGINDANKFITENHLVDSSMFDCDAEELTSLMKRLSKNEEFIALNNSCYNRLTAAMYKYLEFISGSEVESDVDEDLDLTPYEIILQEAFPRGFRLDSAIEIKKFKRHWASLNDEDIELEDKKIEQYIKYCGVVYDGRVYSPSSMLSEELEMKLFSYINSSFTQGVSALYFEALFNEFSDDFLEYCMYNAEMLKEYLAFVNKGQYHINDNFISKDANVVVDPVDEVKRCLINASVPMSYDELYEKLSHIAPQKIKQILNFNSDFISNGRSEYFHIDITVLTEDYLADISTIITDAISDKKFMGGNELIEAISSKYPYIIESNSTISELGLRNAIGYKLKTRFAFEGNIISSKNEHLSMMDVFAEFCKKRSAFTLDELKMLKQELNTTIYFDAVYENSLRVSQTNFVSKEQARFDTVSTDLAIDRFCTGDYIPLYKIDQFGSFPDAGFQWNSYLLEHYVAIYSANYKLIHCTFNETACVGGIVKKSSHIETFDDLITDALSNSYIELEKEAALQFLCDEGYLARRHYSGIGEVLIKANELRNQKGN